jgi:nucleoside-diphosphate kinase
VITAFIVKPNAVTGHHTGEILTIVESAGFEILELRLLTFSREFAGRFYAVHQGKEFYERLITFMTSGPSVIAVLQRDNAIHALRELVGATDPAKAASGSIRALFGETVTINAVHASDSEENALIEAGILFPERFA